MKAQPSWRVPRTSFLAPEGPWTDLLCARLKEFLRLYPVEWINFDPFTYGKFAASDFHVQPASFVKKPFREALGREMPDDAAQITPQESLQYMREMLARQFHRMQEAIPKSAREPRPSTIRRFSTRTNRSGRTIPY